MTILSWHENLPEDEIPPERLWHDGEGLEHWWDRVKERREAKFGGNSGSLDLDDDDVEENALAAAFKK